MLWNMPVLPSPQGYSLVLEKLETKNVNNIQNGKVRVFDELVVTMGGEEDKLGEESNQESQTNKWADLPESNIS